MADDKDADKTDQQPGITNDDGQDGNGATTPDGGQGGATEKVTPPAPDTQQQSKNEVAWDVLVAAAYDAEQKEGPDGRRVVALFHPAPALTVWKGVYGSAPVKKGKAAYKFSDGKKVTL